MAKATLFMVDGFTLVQEGGLPVARVVPDTRDVGPTGPGCRENGCALDGKFS